MGEAIRAAEARLHARMASVQTRYVARWRFRSYVLPIGLVAGAMLISAEMQRQPGGMLTMIPLLCAAVWSRAWGGITAARVAVVPIAPVALWVAYLTWGIYTPLWAPFIGLTLIGLCIERASSVQYELTPDRRSAPDLADTPLAYRALTRPRQGHVRFDHF